MKRILVVEDNEQNIYMLTFMLKKHGFEVIQAMDGLSGIKMAIEQKPDLIIMDWQLPDINGIEVTKRLRENDALKNLPIVFCTSNAMRGDREIALNAGATAFFEKPINPVTFVEAIKKYFT